MMKYFLRNNSGSALVELALTAPLLMLIILASAELGRLAYYSIEVQSAARAGAAYASQNIGFALGPTSAIVQAAENEVPDITDLTFPSPGPTTVCVCETITNSTGTPSYTPNTGPISCYSSPGVLNSDFTDASCTTTNSTESQRVIEYVQVSTQAIVKPMFNYPGIPSSFTLSGTSTMRVGQN